MRDAFILPSACSASSASPFDGLSCDTHIKTQRTQRRRGRRGDLLLRKGQNDQALSNFRLAYQLDPKLAMGASLDEYIAGRMKN
jgi:hypothetical protein